MERDKRGRFVKKAIGGASLNSGFSTSLNTSLNTNQSNTLLGQTYLSPKIKYTMYEDGKYRDQYGREIDPYTVFRDQYKWDNNGFVKDESGNLVPTSSFSQKYQRDNNLLPVEIKETMVETEGTGVGEGTGETGNSSSGMNIFNKIGDGLKNSLNQIGSKPIDKGKLSDFLELTGGAIATSVNNKIAKRALEAEKPLLQDVSESHRSIYGDYRAQMEGEKAAAKLRNAAANPITSDGALQQQMMMDAQIKGQEYIDKGNAQDEAMIRQTRETAWAQEKENQQQRQAAATQNKQAMLMTEKNKAQIENARDSANFSQVIAPWFNNKISRLRGEAEEQKAYKDYYNDAIITSNVWNSNNLNLTPGQKELQKIYLTNGLEKLNEYIGDDETRNSDWNQLQQIMQNEIIRQQALNRGVQINPQLLSKTILSNPQYGIFGNTSNNIFQNKKGGTIYKARLVKRTRDNDRAVKHNESNQKIAARFLEKALESLYTYNDVELIAKPNNKKKRKYQAGGSLPFVGFSTTPATSERGIPSSTKKETKGEDLTTKDILELLKDVEGLPSDIDAIQRELKNFVISNKRDPLGLASSSSIEARYMSIIGKIKKAKANREWYDKAYEKLSKDGALNEYAVDSNGKFIGMNDQGDFERFSAQQISNGETKGYQILTNGNLLNIRAKYPNAAFNSALITEAANGVSMAQVTKYISDTIQGLGSDKTQTQVFGDQSKEVLAGLKSLQLAAQEVGQDLSISQLYEANVLSENQINQAELALDFLYRTLPTNMKALLFAKTGNVDEAKNLIKTLVYSKLSSTNKLEFSPKSKKSTNSSKTSKTGNVTIDGLELSPAQMLQNGFGERSTIIIQDSSPSGLKVDALMMPITKNGNESIGASTLENVVTSQYGGLLDFTNASMGGQVIPFEGRRNIAIDGSRIYAMYLPIDQDEFASSGNIVPDISLIDKVNEVNKIIREKQITDYNEINALYEQSGLPVYLNQDGSVIPTLYRKFGVLNGTALDNAFGKNFVDSKYLKKIDDEDIINGAINIMNQGRNKEDRIKYDDKNFFNFGGLLGEYDTVYQGTIFIPMSDDVFSGIASSGKTITSTEANDLYEKQQQQQKISTYKNPGQL